MWFNQYLEIGKADAADTFFENDPDGPINSRLTIVVFLSRDKSGIDHEDTVSSGYSKVLRPDSSHGIPTVFGDDKW